MSTNRVNLTSPIHTRLLASFSRVPCVGERVSLDGKWYRVQAIDWVVIHEPGYEDAEPETVAWPTVILEPAL